jgi:hypothetical protein
MQQACDKQVVNGLCRTCCEHAHSVQLATACIMSEARLDSPGKTHAVGGGAFCCSDLGVAAPSQLCRCQWKCSSHSAETHVETPQPCMPDDVSANGIAGPLALGWPLVSTSILPTTSDTVGKRLAACATESVLKTCGTGSAADSCRSGSKIQFRSDRVSTFECHQVCLRHEPACSSSSAPYTLYTNYSTCFTCSFSGRATV